MAEEPSIPTPPQPSDPIQADIDGNALLVIESGEARMQAIIDLIAGAKERVRLLFYLFNNDDSGKKVLDAVVDACRRGVKVEMLLDGFGCADADQQFFESIREAGGAFCMFHPSYGRRYLVRNHQKLAIADEQAVIMGGSNIHDSYMKDDGPKHWRDLWLRIEGDSAQSAARYFDDIYAWTTTKGSKLRELRRIVARHSQSKGALQWKFSGPVSRRYNWATVFGQELAQAKRLDLIAAYFSPPRSMIRRIGRLSARGGTVRVITASRSDNHATVSAARHTYSRLLRRGVEIYEYLPARLHTKLAVLDDAVHIGSSNFDFRSLYINMEVMLRIEDSAFADAMRGYFGREKSDSEQVTPELHKKRANPIARLRWLISHWLVTSMDYTVTRRLNLGG